MSRGYELRIEDQLLLNCSITRIFNEKIKDIRNLANRSYKLGLYG